MKKITLFSSLLLGALFLSACSFPSGQKDSPLVLDDNEQEKFSNLSDGEYFIEKDDSHVVWTGAMGKVKSHSGSVPLNSGSLMIDGGQLVAGEFELSVVDLKSFEDSAGLEKHLKSEDFFNVEEYPTANLKIDNVSSLGNNSFQIESTLTIKGISQSVSFSAQLSMEGDSLKASGDLSIDRSLWDVRYGSGKFFTDLGDKAIDDEIKFTINLELKK